MTHLDEKARKEGITHLEMARRVLDDDSIEEFIAEDTARQLIDKALRIINYDNWAPEYDSEGKLTNG